MRIIKHIICTASFIALLGFSSFQFISFPLPSITADAVRDNPLAFGNPSDATNDISNKFNFLMVKDGYSFSYNDSLGYPNWVGWHLNVAWRGNSGRYNGKFKEDKSLPEGFLHLTHNDYSNSGFDRGHLCPSADRTTSKKENEGTFLMTNIYPQSPNLNQQTWRFLEEYCQKSLTDNNKECYIFAGGFGSGGVAKDGSLKFSIGNGKVNVPAYCWKVILVLPNGVEDFSRIDTSSRIIAVWMPNSQQVNKHKWESFRVSVDEIEKLTGFDFFSSIPDEVENVIEAKVDAVSIP